MSSSIPQEKRVQAALELCSKIEPVLRTAGLHCALTGSTLYGLGKTNKDVDVLIYSHNGEKGRQLVDVDQVLTLLRSVLGTVFKTTDADYCDVLRYYLGGVVNPDAIKFDFICVNTALPA